MDIMKVAILGIVGVVFAIQLKQEKADIAIYVCIAVSLVIFLGMIKPLGIFVQTMREIEQYINIEGTYLATLLKMIGITYLAEFSAGICKDAGYQSLASQIEMFGKVTIFVLSIPVLLTLLRTIQEFFG